jgi:streptogramin lyase
MIISRRLRLAMLFACAVILASSSTAQASEGLTRVLTMSPPSVPESIAFDNRGNMYMGLPFASSVVKATRDGVISTIATFPSSTFPLGVRLDRKQNVFVAVAGSGVWEIPASGGSAKQLVAQAGLWNGLAFDRRGNLFVSESHGGAIWRLGRDGTFALWSDSSLLLGTTSPGPCGLVHPAVPSFGPLGANGIEFNRDGDLMVANTDLGTIVRIRTNRDGSAGTARVFAGPDCNLWGADGVAIDNKNNLYVAANSKGQIDRVDPEGELEVIAAGDPLNFPSDIAFMKTGERNEIFISNFAAFATSPGAPGVLKMMVGGRGEPND